MNYWRMQLHPSESNIAVKHSITCLAAGYIGLDFGYDTGNLLNIKKEDLRPGQQDFWEFAHVMKRGDIVLIIAHHFPFALVRVAGAYNYIKTIDPNIGVWFRHFRQVKSIHYYADYKTNAHQWQQLRMTDTISILKNNDKKSYRFIEKWLKDIIRMLK
jgi:hypothetical protein